MGKANLKTVLTRRVVNTPRATWTVFLIDDNNQPHAPYGLELTEGETHRWTAVALEKLFDGSDCDAILVTRSDIRNITVQL